jgi:hypothetical protein
MGKILKRCNNKIFLSKNSRQVEAKNYCNPQLYYNSNWTWQYQKILVQEQNNTAQCARAMMVNNQWITSYMNANF